MNYRTLIVAVALIAVRFGVPFVGLRFSGGFQWSNDLDY